MKKRRFSEEHILELLRELQGGAEFEAVCLREGVTAQTVERWKGIYHRRLIDTAPDARPSRSQRTRDANQANKFGVVLVGLNTTQLDRLTLPEELREAIDVCKELKKSGRGRQQRLVGKLLREGDWQQIRLRLEGVSDPSGRD